jgi:hypothetical protein
MIVEDVGSFSCHLLKIDGNSSIDFDEGQRLSFLDENGTTATNRS